MRKVNGMTVICSLLPLLAACATPAPSVQPQRQPIYVSLAEPGAEVDAGAARDLINGYRRNHGLPPLQLDSVLMAEAKRQSVAMAAAGDVGRGTRTDIRQRLASAGLAVKDVRESPSAGYFTVSDAFSGWRGSPVHDATLKLAGGRRMGVAATHRQGSRHNIYWALIVSE
jgi:uncharacterized protein YkwD